MGRRRAVVLTEGLGESNDTTGTEEPEEEEKKIDTTTEVWKVRGLFTVPILRTLPDSVF